MSEPNEDQRDILRRATKILGYDPDKVIPRHLMAPKPPMLDCPKCGQEDVGLRWVPKALDFSNLESMCPLGDREHFHRICQGCGYSWPTDDVLKGEAT